MFIFDHHPYISDPPKCHARYVRPAALVECNVAVPQEVQELMSVPVPSIKFYHVDPTEALVRLLIAGPLAADPGNCSFFQMKAACIMTITPTGNEWPASKRPCHQGAPP